MSKYFLSIFLTGLSVFCMDKEELQVEQQEEDLDASFKKSLSEAFSAYSESNKKISKNLLGKLDESFKKINEKNPKKVEERAGGSAKVKYWEIFKHKDKNMFFKWINKEGKNEVGNLENLEKNVILTEVLKGVIDNLKNKDNINIMFEIPKGFEDQSEHYFTFAPCAGGTSFLKWIEREYQDAIVKGLNEKNLSFDTNLDSFFSKAMYKFGVIMGRLHCSQITHGDLHLNNIYFDKDKEIFSFIDLETVNNTISKYNTEIKKDLDNFLKFILHQGTSVAEFATNKFKNTLGYATSTKYSFINSFNNQDQWPAIYRSFFNKGIAYFIVGYKTKNHTFSIDYQYFKEPVSEVAGLMNKTQSWENYIQKAEFEKGIKEAEEGVKKILKLDEKAIEVKNFYMEEKNKDQKHELLALAYAIYGYPKFAIQKLSLGIESNKKFIESNQKFEEEKKKYQNKYLLEKLFVSEPEEKPHDMNKSAKFYFTKKPDIEKDQGFKFELNNIENKNHVMSEIKEESEEPPYETGNNVGAK